MVTRDYDKDVEKLYDFWKEQIPIIKEQSFDRRQIFQIKRDFIRQLFSSIITDEVFKLGPELKILESKLNIALEISFSNYRRENNSFWEKIFGYSLRSLPQLIKK